MEWEITLILLDFFSFGLVFLSENLYENVLHF